MRLYLVMGAIILFFLLAMSVFGTFFVIEASAVEVTETPAEDPVVPTAVPETETEPEAPLETAAPASPPVGVMTGSTVVGVTELEVLEQLEDRSVELLEHVGVIEGFLLFFVVVVLCYFTYKFFRMFF